MARKHPLQQLMEKPLSRKDFLRYVLAIFLGTFGLTRTISQILDQTNHQQVSQSSGRRWGNGKFGV